MQCHTGSGSIRSPLSVPRANELDERYDGHRTVASNGRATQENSVGSSLEYRLDTDWLLGQFGGSRSGRIDRYIEFVQQGVRGPSIWDHLKGQVFLGSEAFVESMQRKLEATAKHAEKEIPRLQRRTLAKSLDYYRETSTIQVGNGRRLCHGGLHLAGDRRKFQVVVVFATADKLDSFVNQGWEFGDQTTAAAATGDKGASQGALAVSPGVAYQLAEKGLALEAT